MRKFFTTAIASAVLSVGFIVGAGTAPAQAMSGLSAVPAQTSDFKSNIVNVQRRRRGGGRVVRRRGGRNVRRGVAIGVGAAILGGIIASQAARSQPYYDEPPRAYYRPRRRASWRARLDRCARNFRSFSYRTRTIIGYDGIERRCPYL